MKLKQMARILAAGLLTLAVSVWPAAAETAVTVTLPGTYAYDKAFDIVTAVNEERAREGLSPLTMDRELLEGAMLRAAETSLFFDHTRPDGTDCFTISAKAMGENIAAGSSTAEGTMNQWMNSSGHRANILSTRWKSIGVGSFRMGSTWYWVQVFSPQAAETVARPANRDVEQPVSATPDRLEPVGSLSKNSLRTGETASVTFGWDNQGWQGHTALSAASDLDFTSSNLQVARPDGKGGFLAVGPGNATLTVSLKSLPSKQKTFSVTVTGEAIDPVNPVSGDVNRDGRVTAEDALLTLQAATGKITLSAEQQRLADVDGKAGVTASDALLVLQAATGKITLS